MGKSGESIRIRRQIPDVLHDGGVHARGDQGVRKRWASGHFVGKDQRVEGDITLDAAAVEKLHQLRQIGLGEILRPHAGVEAVQAEVNGVGPIFHGGPGAVPVAGGGREARGAADWALRTRLRPASARQVATAAASLWRGKLRIADWALPIDSATAPGSATALLVLVAIEAEFSLLPDELPV